MAGRPHPSLRTLPGVAVVDAQGRVLSWSAATERLTGWSTDMVLGHPVCGSDGTGTAGESLLAELAACSPDGFPLSLRDPGGAVTRCHAYATPVASTGLYAVLLVAREAAMAELAPFPDEDPSPLLRISAAGEIVYANPAARVVLGPSDAEGSEPPEEALRRAARACLEGNTARDVEIAAVGNRTYAFACVPCPDRACVTLYGRDTTPYRLAEDTLVRERAHLRGILEAMSVGMLLVDEDGAVRHVNDTVSRWVGGTLDIGKGPQPGEVVGCIHAVRRAGQCGQTPYCRTCTLRNAFESVFRSGQSIRGVETRLCLLRQGERKTLWLEINADPLVLEGRRHVLMALSNITDRKRTEDALRESEARFRTLADNIAQLAWMADADGTPVWFNKRWYDFTGLDPAGAAPDAHTRLHHPDHLPHVLTGWKRAIATGDTWEDTYPLRGKDGQYRWFLSRAIPIRDASGKIIRWFGTNTDVTEQRRLEETLRRQAEELAAADRAKDDFLAMLAHELRNPLGAISNAAALIETQADGLAALRKPVDILNRQVKHTARLVDDLLDVSRISRGKMELRRGTLELSAVLQRAAETASPQMEVFGHALTVSLPDAPLWVDGDQARLEQVIGNLLANAAKYTDPGGHVALSLAREGDEAVIAVADDGQGIAPEMLPRIFSLFVQEDRSLARSKGGLGIGLTLVKSLAEMHGGSVAAHSEGPGCGSRFVVRLPLRDVQRSEPDGRPGAEDPGRPRRILVVEDNVDAAAALGDILEAWGHAVTVVHDGPTALAAAARHTPDVALIDIGLPVMDGYEVARAMRREQATAHSRLIALTGYGQDADQRRSREAGFDRHLVKPVEMELLKTALADGPAPGRD